VFWVLIQQGHCDDGLCFGRLPYTWPKDLSSAGDLNDYQMLGTRKTFRYDQPDPLFPFGWGLQYAGPFLLSSLSVIGPTGDAIAPCESVTFRVIVKNTGQQNGAEVVQVYVRWLDAPVAAPALELVQFDRVFVRAGEHVNTTLTVDPRRMALLLPPRNISSTDVDQEQEDDVLPEWWVVSPLRMEFSIGTSQPTFGQTLSAIVSIGGGPSKRVADCASPRAT
jgi:hypothetical protein